MKTAAVEYQKQTKAEAKRSVPHDVLPVAASQRPEDSSSFSVHSFFCSCFVTIKDEMFH